MQAPPSPPARAAIAPMLLLLALCAIPSARAQTDTTVRALGADLRLRFTDLSQGTLHACKLSDDRHEIMFIAGVNNVLVNGRTLQLDQPITWNQDRFLLSRESAGLVAAALKQRPGPHPPPPTPTPVKQPAPARPAVVVIDPGHGGRDPGAVRANLQEKTVNLDISRRLKRLLEAAGHKVIMTRTDDTYLSPDARIAKANHAAPDLFISIHANAEPVIWGTATGAMTIYPPKGRRSRKPPIDQRAKTEVLTSSISPVHFGAAGNITQATMVTSTKIAFETYRWMSIAAANNIQEQILPVSGASGPNHGVTEDRRGLRILSRIHAPAVLVEVDFMSNRARNAKLATDSYRAALAAAVAKGVLRFLDRHSAERSLP